MVARLVPNGVPQPSAVLRPHVIEMLELSFLYHVLETWQVFLVVLKWQSDLCSTPRALGSAGQEAERVPAAHWRPGHFLFLWGGVVIQLLQLQ